MRLPFDPFRGQAQIGQPAQHRADGPGWGVIIDAASHIALIGCADDQTAYSTSKGGVSALTRTPFYSEIMDQPAALRRLLKAYAGPDRRRRLAEAPLAR